MSWRRFGEKRQLDRARFSIIPRFADSIRRMEIPSIGIFRRISTRLAMKTVDNRNRSVRKQSSGGRYRTCETSEWLFQQCDETIILTVKNEGSMSLVRLLGFTTLSCGCVVGKYPGARHEPRGDVRRRKGQGLQQPRPSAESHGCRRAVLRRTDRSVYQGLLINRSIRAVEPGGVPPWPQSLWPSNPISYEPLAAEKSGCV